MTEQAGVRARARRHHLVSRFYLRGFADGTRLRCAPRDGGDEFLTSIGDATVRNDFYTVTAPDGTRSDAFEAWMGEVESDARPVLDTLVAGEQPPPVGDERLNFAGWVALMHLRGDAQRRMVTQVGALFDAAQKAGAVGLLEDQMRGALESSAASSAAVEADEHVGVVRGLMPKVAAFLMMSPWRVLHLAEGSLVVSDHPIDLVPATGPSPNTGIGLKNARVMLPLARHTLLFIDTPRAWGGLPDVVKAATAGRVQYCNQQTMLNARSAVYRHPDDPLPKPMSSFPPPRSTEIAFEVMSPRSSQLPS